MNRRPVKAAPMSVESPLMEIQARREENTQNVR